MVKPIPDTCPRVMPGSTPRPVEDKFYGDRGGEFEDPFGHRWSIASHIEDLSSEEMEQRMGRLPG